jgi:hypothetical protein
MVGRNVPPLERENMSTLTQEIMAALPGPILMSLSDGWISGVKDATRVYISLGVDRYDNHTVVYYTPGLEPDFLEVNIDHFNAIGHDLLTEGFIFDEHTEGYSELENALVLFQEYEDA